MVSILFSEEVLSQSDNTFMNSRLREIADSTTSQNGWVVFKKDVFVSLLSVACQNCTKLLGVAFKRELV